MMKLLHEVVAFHVNAFTYLVYQMETHWGVLVVFASIAYLMWKDLKAEDVKFVYDKRKMM